MSDGEHIRALIAERHDEGWSYRKIAQNAGNKIGHTFVQKLATRGRKHAPARADLAALAEGLRMPEERVFEAANKDWTTAPNLIRVEDDKGVTVIASQLREMPDESVQTVREIVDSLYRRMKEEERRRAQG